jgi:hypothetical protein
MGTLAKGNITFMKQNSELELTNQWMKFFQQY